MVNFSLIGDDQLASIIHGVVLNQRIDSRAIGREVGNHVDIVADDDLPIQYVVVGVVAVVDHIREFHHQACRVALAIGAGIGVVGWDAVVGKKLGITQFIDDNASAGAFDVGCEIEPSADIVQLLVLH